MAIFKIHAGMGENDPTVVIEAESFDATTYTFKNADGNIVAWVNAGHIMYITKQKENPSA